MKSKFLKLSFVSLLLLHVFSVGAQHVNDVNRGVVHQDSAPPPPMEIAYPEELPGQNVPEYNSHYYKWEVPVFEAVDLNRLQQYKAENQAYLREIEALEDIQKRNKQQLKSYQDQVKDLTKALKIEQKNLNEKRRFYREDEKLLKRERKLRDQEEKMIKKERKELRKQTQEMATWQIEDRLAKLNEREQRIHYATERWEYKRETLHQNIAKVSETQTILNDKSFELKTRERELAAYGREQKMVQKQLSLKKNK